MSIKELTNSKRLLSSTIERGRMKNLKVSFYSSDTEFFGAFGSVADTKRKTSADSETADALIAEINDETISIS